MEKTRIKELRKQRGMTQAELGAKLGISASTVGMYEQGRRDPDTPTLLKLARALNVSVDYLIMASDVQKQFDVDEIARHVAENLIQNEALMFSSDCYTAEELSDLAAIIEVTVKASLKQKIE